MIPKDCKRLAEVDFPIASVSKHAAREKSIRHGNPSTLHLWWARRPIASCRAILLALLLPDPCDSLCPPAFKNKAREILGPIPGRVGGTDEELREALLRFIGDFADWARGGNATFLEAGRNLVKASHPDEAPLVVDPFAGGGSIPLEALRLGCDAFASDLNPVACLILKTMLEDIPRQGPTLAKELQQICNGIKASAEKTLAKFYGPEAGGVRPIAYLWARTVRCEAPNCGAEIPLLRSFWLSKKSGRLKALRYSVHRSTDASPRALFEIFTPEADAQVPRGTVTRAKATCLCCGTTLAPDRVRFQLQQLRGGANPVLDHEGKRVAGATLMAVITKSAGNSGAHYRLPVEADYKAVGLAIREVNTIEAAASSNVAPIPDEPLPLMSGTFNVPLYGVTRWGDLFTRRQNLALATLVSEIKKVSASDPLKSCLAMVLGRCADYWSSGTRWAQSGEFVADTFARPALPIIFDFVEVMPFSGASGDFDGAVEWVSRVIETLPSGMSPGQVSLSDARTSPLPDDVCAVWFTDPPYYFAVPYADLSDFFFVWHKRAFPNNPLMRDPFDASNPLSPKGPELCEMAHWDSERYGHKDKLYFENGMAAAFSEGRRLIKDDGIASVVFAHKTTEGWEALLSGITRGGWIITASWPIATERPGRPRSQDSAALATSIHLVCRPRAEDAPIGDWANVLRELPTRVGDWMERLQSEGVRGADLVFACIGPALEIFSRYAKVETADGREIKLDEYLEKVWEVVGRSALSQVLGTAEARARNGSAGAVEEDARLTALFLWTLQSTNNEAVEKASDDEADEEPADDEDEEGAARGKAKGFTLVFDVVRRFAQPLGIDLPKWEGRVIEIKKGVVRLLPIAERAKQLFGDEGAQTVAAQLELGTAAGANPLQGLLFPEMVPTPRARGRGVRGRSGRIAVGISDESLATAREATTLDRVHAAMLLQAGGRTNALRALLKAEQERSPDFLRLANALSALYPKGSEEKRLLDAMLLAVPR